MHIQCTPVLNLSRIEPSKPQAHGGLWLAMGLRFALEI